MINILLGAGVFTTVLGFTTAFLIKRKGYSYREEYYIFSPLFLLAVIVLIGVSSEIRPYLALGKETALLLVVVLGFVALQHVYGRLLGGDGVYGYDSIPEDAKQVVDFNVRTAFSKTCEIALQQFCALLIVVGLASLGISVF